jgi:hypothetical protein
MYTRSPCRQGIWSESKHCSNTNTRILIGFSYLTVCTGPATLFSLRMRTASAIAILPPFTLSWSKGESAIAKRSTLSFMLLLAANLLMFPRNSMPGVLSSPQVLSWNSVPHVHSCSWRVLRWRVAVQWRVVLKKGPSCERSWYGLVTFCSYFVIIFSP